MAFNYYFSVEQLCLRTAEEHIQRMTDDNFEDDGETLNIARFSENIANGFIVLTMLSSYMESTINTIMVECMGYDDKKLNKIFKMKSKPEKLQEIFMYYSKQIKTIQDNNWDIFITSNRIRNELIHFKKCRIGMAGAPFNFSIKGEKVGQFFTRENMVKIISAHKTLVKNIAGVLGLCVNDNIEIIMGDGSGLACTYISLPI